MAKKIKIEEVDGTEREIELKNPKGKHVKKATKFFTGLTEMSESGELKALDRYMDYLEVMACESSGISVELLDEQDTEVKEDIIGHYQNFVTSRINFIKSSLMLENSTEKVNNPS